MESLHTLTRYGFFWTLYPSPVTVGIRLRLLPDGFGQPLRGQFYLSLPLFHINQQLSEVRNKCTTPRPCIILIHFYGYYHTISRKFCQEKNFLVHSYHRGNRIWTCDLTAPSRARYQATPYPASTAYYTRIAYKKQTIFQIPVCSCMCTTFLVNGAKSQWQGLAWGFPNSHLHREGLPYQVRYCHFHWQPVDFLVWLRRL